MQLAKETDTNCCTFSKLPDILGSGQPYEVIGSKSKPYEASGCKSNPYKDASQSLDIGSASLTNMNKMLWLLLHHKINPHQNGSGLSGVADLRLGKGLLQLENQEDFSHQVSL